LGIGENRHGLGGQLFTERRQIGQTILVDNQAIQGVAHADTTGLGVEHHSCSFFQVGVHIEVGVANAGARFNDGDGGVFANKLDKIGATSGYEEVHVVPGI